MTTAQRLKDDPDAINRNWNDLRASYGRARRDFDMTGQYPNHDIEQLDRHFNRVRAQLGQLGHSAEALKLAEGELARFAEHEATATMRLADHHARENVRRQAASAALRQGGTLPSLTPTIDAALPLLKQRIDALVHRIKVDGRDDQEVFNGALDELENAIKAFSTAIGIERRAARQRVAKRAAATAIADALVAA